MASELHSIICSHYASDNYLLNVGSFFPPRDVVQLLYIDTASDGGSSVEPASDETQCVSSTISKSDFKGPTRRSTKLRRKPMMRTRSDAAPASSKDLLVTKLESDCKCFSLMEGEFFLSSVSS